MAEASPDKIVIGAIGPLMTTVIGAAIGWLPGGLTELGILAALCQAGAAN